MSCTNCTSPTPFTFDVQFFTNNACATCDTTGCSTTLTAACVYYAGPNLPCSLINTDDSLELALQKIDEQVCSLIGDYSTYNFHCLTAVDTEAEFVSEITDYVCTLRTDLDTFVDTTFVEYQAEVDARFNDIEVPGITCTFAGVTSSDTISQVFTKYCTAFSDLDDAISLSDVDWDDCLTVVTPPTTIAGAFSTVLDQICQVKALTAGALPTFNNTGSCLASPGSVDTLVSTVDKIKTRLCLSPTFDNDNLTSTCITIPATDTDLEALLQNILTTVDTLSQAKPVFDGSDFTLGVASCDGVSVALATPLNQDRFVASNAGDVSPGTLQSKLTAGTNVTLDFATTPGQAIINASGGTDTYQVKANTADDTPGFLDQKVSTSDDSSGVSLNASYDGGTKKLNFAVSTDISDLWNSLLELAESDADIKTRICELIASCPSPCDPPTNVSAVAQGNTTTSTTTIA